MFTIGRYQIRFTSRRGVLAGAVLGWLIALLLAGCAAQPAGAPQPTALVAAVETATVVPTATAEPAATPTPTANAEPTSTPTLPATATAVPTATATATPEPATALLTTTLALDNPFFAANPPPLILRRGPEDYFQTVGSVQPGDAVTVIGRNATGSKVLVRLSDGAEGWAWRHVFTADKDAALALPVVEAPAELYDEEKIERIEFGGALDPAGRYVAYLKQVIRRIQAEDKSGVAPIPNTRQELISAPGYAQWAAAFEAGVGYPAEKILSELTQEDWLYPTYGSEYAGPLQIRVYVSEDQQGLIGWDWAGYLPEYIPIIDIPQHILDRALAGDEHSKLTIYLAMIKEMVAGKAGYIAATFDPSMTKYDLPRAVETTSYFALYEFVRQQASRQGYTSEFVAYFLDVATNFQNISAKTGQFK